MSDRRSIRPALLAVLVLGCAGRDGNDAVDMLDFRLTDGEPIRALVHPADTAVVLLYDPGDCFTCASPVAAWLAVRRQRPGLVHLLFVRRPTQAEQHQLTLYRVVPDGNLKQARRVSTPMELLVVNGVVVDQRTGRDETSSLLDRFR
jgi:hypothetical protein